MLNGKSTRLIKDKTDGQWRLEADDASKVIRSTGADNGDDNGEHWTVTTGDGTKYVFGLNKLDGAGTERTNSTWTVPVFGDDSGEPGYSSGDSFADRALTQAWRWNLDYVEDTHGNASTYWYTKESNHYKKNKAETANTSYTRGGYLTRIEYGLRKGALFTDKADAKVTFNHADGLVVDCRPPDRTGSMRELRSRSPGCEVKGSACPVGEIEPERVANLRWRARLPSSPRRGVGGDDGGGLLGLRGPRLVTR
ncbi:hypothetical protein GCM10010255_62020 [Streptomyces coeruleofuscus]|uniref:Ricin B lectin domain-containing protein n=1 Tax=Streptomyces coeruleofuscus TaxID=66879 RepID=A0ABN3IVS8_9ACTN